MLDSTPVSGYMSFKFLIEEYLDLFQDLTMTNDIAKNVVLKLYPC